MQTQSFSSIMGKGCMSRNALKCLMLSVLPKESKVLENNGFFSFLTFLMCLFSSLMNIMKMENSNKLGSLTGALLKVG